MPRLGFSIVPVDPFKKPKREQLHAVEKQCKADFSPFYTEVNVFDSPQLIISGENEVCMTCPKCGTIDKEYKWFNLLEPLYNSEDGRGEFLNFDCLMHCCNQAANILDFDFRYPTKGIELGAGFASAEVHIAEVNTRVLKPSDLLDFTKLMGCPVRTILVTS